MGEMNPLEKCEKCPDFIFEDVQAYIQQLEAERDAAVHDLEQSRYCDVCKHLEEKEELCEHYDLPSQCFNCSLGKSQFLWRGPCEENGGQKEEEK